MNKIFDEDDLRAALLDIGADAPAVRDVLPPRAAPQRGSARWFAPLAVAVLVLAVGVVIAVVRYNPIHSSAIGDRLHRSPSSGRASQLTGLSWSLVQVGTEAAPSGLGLYIEPNGRFSQGFAFCASFQGQVDVERSHLVITHRQVDGGLCPVIPHSRDPRRAAHASDVLRTVLRGDVSWSVTDGRLVLSKPGRPALTYAPTRNSPRRTRTFTYRGVGVVVPRSWVKNATRCGQPTQNTVLLSNRPVATCSRSRPFTVSTVEFESYQPLDPGKKAVGRSTILIDGVEAVETVDARTLSIPQGPAGIQLDIASRGVSILVSSPSRAHAGQLAQAVYLVHP